MERFNQKAAVIGPLLWYPGLGERVASFLEPNEVACNLRLVNKATARLFATDQHKTIHLSRHCPRTTFAWRWGRPGATKLLTRRERQKLVALTAASGSIPNLEVAVPSSGLLLPCEVWASAAGAGHLHVCEWLLAHDCALGDDDGRALSAAAEAGHEQACEWLLAHGCPWHSAAVRAATRTGDLALADWLLCQRPSGPPRSGGLAGRALAGALLAAAANGCELATLQHLHQELLEGPPRCPGGPAQTGHLLAQPQEAEEEQDEEAAAEGEANGELALDLEAERTAILACAAGSATPDWRAKVEWLEGRGYPPTAEACEVAARQPGTLGRLAWLVQRGYPLSTVAVTSAAGAGNLSALQYLLSHGAAADASAAEAAAAAGHVSALQVLQAAGCPIDAVEALRTAAVHGHLAVVSWLVEASGLEVALDADLFTCAAKSGSVELMAWLRERGCSWDGESAFEGAAFGGCEAALEWLVEQGCPTPTNAAPFLVACVEGDLATLRCLRRLGCPWGADGDLFTVCAAAGFIRLPVLRWLAAEGCPVKWDDAAAAARLRQGADAEEVAAWVLERTVRQRRRHEQEQQQQERERELHLRRQLVEEAATRQRRWQWRTGVALAAFAAVAVAAWRGLRAVRARRKIQGWKIH